MIRTIGSFRLAALALAVCAGGCSSAPCDAASLRSALEAAAPGAVVRAGDCRIEGVSVTVPAGVVLEGGGASSTLAGSSAIVTLAAGATLRAIDVDVDGGVGVTAGAGAVVVEDVGVRVARGVGLVLRGSD